MLSTFSDDHRLHLHLILAQFSVQEQNLPRRITGIEYQSFADGRILLEYHIPSLSPAETQLSHSQSPQPLPYPWPCRDPLAYLHLRTRCTLRHAAGTNLQIKKKESLIIIIVQSAESRQENNRKVRNDVTKQAIQTRNYPAGICCCSRQAQLARPPTLASASY
jgi:hypothetical protein